MSLTGNQYKDRAIELLLRRGEGDMAVLVYHDGDPAEVRDTLRERGYLQGAKTPEDDDLAKALWNWVADDIGAESVIE